MKEIVNAESDIVRCSVMYTKCGVDGWWSSCPCVSKTALCRLRLLSLRCVHCPPQHSLPCLPIYHSGPSQLPINFDLWTPGRPCSLLTCSFRSASLTSSLGSGNSGWMFYFLFNLCCADGTGFCIICCARGPASLTQHIFTSFLVYLWWLWL